MATNNEISVLQPLAAIGQRCRDRGILFHTDAAQVIGKIELYQFAEFGRHIQKVCSPLRQGGSDSGGFPICSATLQNWY
ncbi:MAG: aminotransferase class V-fold PLP-dependent enzyme [Leptolyngbyaceae cyanobacterium]